MTDVSALEQIQAWSREGVRIKSERERVLTAICKVVGPVGEFTAPSWYWHGPAIAFDGLGMWLLRVRVRTGAENAAPRGIEFSGPTIADCVDQARGVIESELEHYRRTLASWLDERG